MAYEPITWVDRIVERSRTFTMIHNEDGTVTLVPQNGNVIQQGTPLNAENLNHMEAGIIGLVNSIAMIAQTQNSQAEELDGFNQGFKISAVLYASDWQGSQAPYTITASVSGLPAQADAIIGLEMDLSAAVTEAAAAAMMRCTGQGVDSITVEAYGEKPQVDIPVALYVMGVLNLGAQGASGGVAGGVADRLSTPRTISLSGDASGSSVFDGSRDININTNANTLTNSELEAMMN